MLSVIAGFLGGVVAWFCTALIGNPLVSFMAARTEAERVLTLYKKHDRFDPDADDFLPVDEARKEALASAGASLVAFAGANQILDRHVLRRLNFFPRQAGEHLNLLGQLRSNGSDNELHRGEIKDKLRLGRHFGNTRN